jgi:hypothetical protein
MGILGLEGVSEFYRRGKAMNRKMVKTITLRTLALVTVLCAAQPGRAADPKTLYPSMAPLEQYLMERNAEIAMARSAAPDSISRDATVMVLGRQGYETAIEGKNGFVCLVDRAWMGSFENSPEFWNPKNRGPICFNPPAARSIVPITLLRTKLVLTGESKAEIKESMKTAIEKKELPVLEPGGIAYMMSRQGRLNDDAGHWLPHLMFYVPLTDAMTWGAGVPGSPVLLNPQFNGAPEPVTEFIIPVSEWSDGTPAPPDHL